jgi:RNA polymerase sigma-70 factor, ECF subfamily
VELRYNDAHDGFDTWYASARPKVLTSVALWCGSLDVAADAADEAFARALARWPRVRSMASPAGWTATVAINVARRQARRRQLERTLLRRRAPEDVLPAPAGEVFDTIAALPERQRTIVLLRYVHDLPLGEIAELLGVARSTVTTSLTDAYRRMRPLLVEESPPASPDPMETYRA